MVLFNGGWGGGGCSFCADCHSVFGVEYGWVVMEVWI